MQTRQELGGADERLVLRGMAADAAVLARVAAEWPAAEVGLEGGLFASRYANLVAKLCIRYWQQYGRAPGGALGALFRSWAEAGSRDKELVQTAEHFLAALDSEHAGEGLPAAEYVLDVAGRHFSGVAAVRLAEGIQGDVGLGHPEEACQRVAAWRAPELGVGAGIDVLADTEAMRAAFEERAEALVEWPGALGTFMGAQFCRDSFISFLGPEKRGKTWWLLEVAWQAVRQGRRVALFSIGDMSQAQVLRRLAVRLAGRPLRAGRYTVPEGVGYTGGEPDADGKPTPRELAVQRVERECTEDLEWRAAARAAARWCRMGAGGRLKLSTHPNGTMSAAGIGATCARWARGGWVPDVLVVDYADLLEPMDGRMEYRHQINASWQYLRRLSQEYHCCLVTATQADSASYAVRTLTKSNFSDDKRKLAHVTGMLGINQMPEEKEQGVYRLNWIVTREEAWAEYDCVTVAGSLAYGRPATHSCM